MLLASIISLALILPLRGTPVAFLATLVLFVVPGLLLARLALRESLTGAALLPVAFVLSTGLFSLIGVPALLLHWSLTVYLALCGVILVLSLFALALGILRGGSSTGGSTAPSSRSINWLWVPFAGLAGNLAYSTFVRVQKPLDDSWVYLGYVREYLNTGELGLYNPFSGLEIQSISRMAANGWPLVQAAFARVSGLDPVALALNFLAPTLAVVALLAVYALAKALFESETAALLSGSLAALLLLVDLDSMLLSPGGEFVGRITEDKFVARFVFLPVMLMAAVLFVREKGLRLLGLFALLCVAMVAVHPIGLIFAAVCVGAFGVVHLAVDFRDRRAWRGVGGLAAVLFVITGPPAIYLLATGSPLLSKLDSVNPTTASSLLASWQYEQRLLEYGDGFIVHPALLLNPLVAAVYVVGVPFLAWKLKESLAARLLLGVLVLAPIPIFLPFIAEVLGRLIGPWMLFRLTWPLTLAATLTLGWVCYEVLKFVGSRLESKEPRVLSQAAPFLPLVLVLVLAAAAAAPAAAGLRSTDASGETPQDQSTCQDPIYDWMNAEITTPAKVLAQEEESSCIPAHAAHANVVGFREITPEAVRKEVGYFYNAPVFDGRMLQLLKSQKTDYVLLRTGSPLNVQLAHLPGFTALENPGGRYRLYEVDREKLGITTVIDANTSLTGNDPDRATEVYNIVLKNPESTQDDRLVAHLGLGQAYMRDKKPAKAADEYEQAAELGPEDPAPLALAAQAYNAAGSLEAGRTALERAVDIDPGDAKLRLDLGTFLLTARNEGALDQFRAAVRAYPEVPDYRVSLGKALRQLGDPETARAEFERAADLDPLSPKIHADIGDAYLSAVDFEEAAVSYERALELSPRSQLFAYKLGAAYSALSTQDSLDEEYFGKAEENLEKAAGLEPLPGGQDLSSKALVSLGDLYAGWDRREDAAVAYERTLEVDPNARDAQNKLENLRG